MIVRQIMMLLFLLIFDSRFYHCLGQSKENLAIYPELHIKDDNVIENLFHRKVRESQGSAVLDPVLGDVRDDDLEDIILSSESLVGDSIDSFTEAERKSFADLHNIYRSNFTRPIPSASDMQYVDYNDTLAKYAQKYLELCSLKLGLPDDDTLTDEVGQNLYFGAARDPETALWMFYEGYRDYSFLNQSCSTAGVRCRSFVQMMSSDANQIGCARKSYCHARNPRNTIVHCYYYRKALSLNVPGLQMYRIGWPCTRCSETYNMCHKKLCVSNSICERQMLNCKCQLQCQNCAEPDYETCSCRCKYGWQWPDCSYPCINPADLRKPGSCFVEKENNTSCNSRVMKAQCPESCGHCETPYGKPVTGETLCCSGKTCGPFHTLDTTTCACGRMCPSPLCLYAVEKKSIARGLLEVGEMAPITSLGFKWKDITTGSSKVKEGINSNVPIALAESEWKKATKRQNELIQGTLLIDPIAVAETEQKTATEDPNDTKLGTIKNTPRVLADSEWKTVTERPTELTPGILLRDPIAVAETEQQTATEDPNDTKLGTIKNTPRVLADSEWKKATEGPTELTPGILLRDPIAVAETEEKTATEDPNDTKLGTIKNTPSVLAESEWKSPREGLTELTPGTLLRDPKAVAETEQKNATEDPNDTKLGTIKNTPNVLAESEWKNATEGVTELAPGTLLRDPKAVAETQEKNVTEDSNDTKLGTIKNTPNVLVESEWKYATKVPTELTPGTLIRDPTAVEEAQQENATEDTNNTKLGTIKNTLNVLVESEWKNLTKRLIEITPKTMRITPKTVAEKERRNKADNLNKRKTGTIRNASIAHVESIMKYATKGSTEIAHGTLRIAPTQLAQSQILTSRDLKENSSKVVKSVHNTSLEAETHLGLEVVKETSSVLVVSNDKTPAFSTAARTASFQETVDGEGSVYYSKRANPPSVERNEAIEAVEGATHTHKDHVIFNSNKGLNMSKTKPNSDSSNRTSSSEIIPTPIPIMTKESLNDTMIDFWNKSNWTVFWNETYFWNETGFWNKTHFWNETSSKDEMKFWKEEPSVEFEVNFGRNATQETVGKPKTELSTKAATEDNRKRSIKKTSNTNSTNSTDTSGSRKRLSRTNAYAISIEIFLLFIVKYLLIS